MPFLSVPLLAVGTEGGRQAEEGATFAQGKQREELGWAPILLSLHCTLNLCCSQTHTLVVCGGGVLGKLVGLEDVMMGGAP